MQHVDTTSSAAWFWAFITNCLLNHWGQNPVARGRQQARTACTHLRPLLPKEMGILKLEHGCCLACSVLLCLTEGLSLVSASTVLQDAPTEDFLAVSHYNNFHV